MILFRLMLIGALIFEAGGVLGVAWRRAPCLAFRKIRSCGLLVSLVAAMVFAIWLATSSAFLFWQVLSKTSLIVFKLFGIEVSRKPTQGAGVWEQVYVERGLDGTADIRVMRTPSLFILRQQARSPDFSA